MTVKLCFVLCLVLNKTEESENQANMDTSDKVDFKEIKDSLKQPTKQALRPITKPDPGQQIRLPIAELSRNQLQVFVSFLLSLCHFSYPLCTLIKQIHEV